MSRPCRFCGDGFRPLRGNTRQRYCSLSCASRDKRVLPWLVCPQCEIKFPTLRSGQFLCSRQCSARWQFNPKRLERAA